MHSLFRYLLLLHVELVESLPWHAAIMVRSTQDVLAIALIYFLSYLYVPRPSAPKESYPPLIPTWFLLINQMAVMKAETESRGWKVQMLLIPKSSFCSDLSPCSTCAQPTVCFTSTTAILLESQYKVSKMTFTTLPIKYASFCISCPDEYHHDLLVYPSETWKSWLIILFSLFPLNLNSNWLLSTINVPQISLLNKFLLSISIVLI